ncbi:hypothetical protein M569_01195, partial [Genlisea aurea]
MAVVIESEIWMPNKALYLFLLVACFLSLLYLPAKSSGNVFDHSSSPNSLRFQRNFLAVFVLSSVIQGSSSVFGEYELSYFGFSKEQALNYLCIGYAASLILGIFLGTLFDQIGHRRSCLFFYLLHLSASLLKITGGDSSIWLSGICLSVASSTFFFCFEAWMVAELDPNKVGTRQDTVNDMFWLMNLFESASFVGSQFVGNYLISRDARKSTVPIWKEILLLSLLATLYVSWGWKKRAPEKKPPPRLASPFRVAAAAADARIWLLACAQSCVHFAISTFWIIWAPTAIADGRELSLGMIYPCLIGCKMLGSACSPWLYGPLSLRPEECLVYAFPIMALVLGAVAYDYQEIEVLMILFCVFHACAGVVLPSLARLRTVYVPNEIRGGMMSLSAVPANAALLFLLLTGYVANSGMVWVAAFGMGAASGCMFMLKKW